MAFKYKGLRLKDPSLMKKLRQVPLTFTRASVAYDYKGDAVGVDTPRFQHLINGVMEYGCLIEQAHTNRISASKSECSSLVGFGLSATGEITTEVFLRSPSCLEITSNSYYTGFWTTEFTNVGTVYCYQLMGKIDEGVIVRIETGSTHIDYIGTGEWMPIYLIFTATLSTTDISISILSADTHISYFDMFQFTDNPFPLSWTLGGTTQAAETLTVNPSVLGLSEGTIELEIYLNNSLKLNYGAPISHRDIVGNNYYYCYWDTPTGDWKLMTSNNMGLSTTATLSGSGDTGFINIVTRHNLSKIILTKNGDVVNQSLQSPANIPETRGINIEFGTANGLQSINSIIRNIVTSSHEREDTDVSTRSLQQSPLIDKEITLIAPLTKDLKAYRVRT